MTDPHPQPDLETNAPDLDDVGRADVNARQGVAPQEAPRTISQGDPTGHGQHRTSESEIVDDELRSGAGVDVDSSRMPADGILEVHDDDETILDEEKRHDIDSNGPRPV